LWADVSFGWKSEFAGPFHDFAQSIVIVPFDRWRMARFVVAASATGTS
jgi:hypothetical protein